MQNQRSNHIRSACNFCHRILGRRNNFLSSPIIHFATLAIYCPLWYLSEFYAFQLGQISLSSSQHLWYACILGQLGTNITTFTWVTHSSSFSHRSKQAPVLGQYITHLAVGSSYLAVCSSHLVVSSLQHRAMGQVQSAFLSTNACHSKAMWHVFIGLNASRAMLIGPKITQ